MMEAKEAPGALVLLTPDEVAVVRSYRACGIANRELIRFFVYAAASDRGEHTAELIPFLVRKI